MWNTRLDESQARMKTARKYITHLRYAYDITLMTECEEKLKNLLMKVKEKSKKADLKLNIQKTMVMASSAITSLQMEGEKVETVTLYFLGLQNHCRWWLHAKIPLLLRKKAMKNLASVLKKQKHDFADKDP